MQARRPAGTRSRKLPAYGRELLDLRRRGLVPDPPLIIVSVGWNVTRAHGPHLLGYGLVVGDEDDPGALDFCGVAGLPVLVVSDDETPIARVQSVVDGLLRFAPRSLRAWRIVRGRDAPETRILLKGPA
jgi:hypothetical protein